MLPPRAEQFDLSELLTKREQDVLRLIAAGASNREIAASLFFTIGTVKWYAHQIYEKLGVSNRGEASRMARLFGWFQERNEARAPRFDIPVPTTPFLGRVSEIRQLQRLLIDDASRLVTILGAGGLGKTRLALEFALLPRAKTAWPDGIFWLDLSHVSGTAFIPPALAAKFNLSLSDDEEGDLQSLELVSAYLSRRKALLLLDNFEHLLGGAPLIAELLSRAPKIQILTTSRERLNLVAEHLLILGGLEYPARFTVPTSSRQVKLSEYAAVRLFWNRAWQLRPTIKPSPADDRHVAAICQLLEGLPLAIELAAGWTDVLTPEEILFELKSGIDLLASNLEDLPARHRSIRKIIDRAWAVLHEDDRLALARTSLFVGGFTRLAAAEVCGMDLKQLSRLVGKSMIRVDQSSNRFDVHGLIRQYGKEVLAQLGRQEETERAHSNYYLEFVHSREAYIKGKRQMPALLELQAEYDNIRRAAIWAATAHNYETLDRAVDGLWLYFNALSQWGKAVEFRRHLMKLLVNDQDIRGRGLWHRLATRHGRPRERHKAIISEALNFARSHENRFEEATCLALLGEANVRTGTAEVGLEHLRHSLEIFTELKESFLVLFYQIYLALGKAAMGEAELAAALLAESCAGLHKAGDHYFSQYAMYEARNISWQLGAFDRVEHYTRELMALLKATGQSQLVAQCQLYRVLTEFLRGNFTEAAEVLDACVPLLEKEEDVIFVYADRTGLLAAWLEDYATARQELEWGLVKVQRAWPWLDPIRAFTYNWGLAIASIGLGDYAAASQRLCDGIRRSIKAKEIGSLRLYLPVAALLFTLQDHNERAAELMALATQELAGWTGWLERWRLFVELRANFRSSSGRSRFLQATRRGERLPILPTAEATLHELDSLTWN